MTARSDAEGHLRKAAPFLEAARTNLELELYDSATSDAVVAGINAKDVICLMLTGVTNKTENHAAAINELRVAGQAGGHGARRSYLDLTVFESVVVDKAFMSRATSTLRAYQHFRRTTMSGILPTVT